MDCSDSHHQTLESDERIQTDQLTSSSGESSVSSFPPVVSTIHHSDVHSISHSRRGRGRVDMPFNSCSWVGHSSAAVRGCSSWKPAQSEVTCRSEQNKQLPWMEKDVECGRSDRIASFQATLSVKPLSRTVKLINRVGKHKPLMAEVDSSSPCTVISQRFLATHLSNTLMDPLWTLPSTCGATPIRSLQGTVKIKACNQVVSMTAFVTGAPCQSRIRRDLINSLSLTIHGRDPLTGVAQIQNANTQHPGADTQSSLQSVESVPAL